FERYIGEISQAVSAITGDSAKKLYESLLVQAKKRTAAADLRLNEEGKAIKSEDSADQDGVIIIPSANPLLAEADETSDNESKSSKSRSAKSKRSKKSDKEDDLF
ncbi:MAG TPA: hypothetical protein VG711_11635, partial [Phycisphaerales bacterium]|nr:hypothetical protein [Phycisphaerales bacterium]